MNKNNAFKADSVRNSIANEHSYALSSDQIKKKMKESSSDLRCDISSFEGSHYLSKDEQNLTQDEGLVVFEKSDENTVDEDSMEEASEENVAQEKTVQDTWLTAKAGTFLRSWDSWLVKREEETGDNNSSLNARKVMEQEKPIEKSWDGVSDGLQAGLTFQSRSQVKTFMSMYGEKTHCNMVVTSGGSADGCKSRQITFSCPYGHGRASVATKEGRPIQHSKKKDCEVFVRFSCRGNKYFRNFCVLKAFKEDHNHLSSCKYKRCLAAGFCPDFKNHPRNQTPSQKKQASRNVSNKSNDTNSEATMEWLDDAAEVESKDTTSKDNIVYFDKREQDNVHWVVETGDAVHASTSIYVKSEPQIHIKSETADHDPVQCELIVKSEAGDYDPVDYDKFKDHNTVKSESDDNLLSFDPLAENDSLVYEPNQDFQIGILGI